MGMRFQSLLLSMLSMAAMAQSNPWDSLEGHVITEWGAPVPNVRVHAREGSTHLDVWADKEGHFLFSRLKKGHWTLEATGMGLGLGIVQAKVAPGSSPRGLQLKLPTPSPAIFRGFVTDEKEAPIFGAHILLSGSGTDWSTSTGPEGMFMVPSYPEGEYNLQIMAEGFQTLHWRIRMEGKPIPGRRLKLREAFQGGTRAYALPHPNPPFEVEGAMQGMTMRPDDWAHLPLP